MINGNIPHNHITGVATGTGNHLVIPTLQRLIMNTIAVSEVKKFIAPSGRDPVELLIEEIKKAGNLENLSSISGVKIPRRKGMPSDNPNNNRVYLIKKLPGFMKFFKFNFLKDEILIDSAPFLGYVFYPKGSVIFREGERSSKFYIIGRGKISMRVKKVKKKTFEVLLGSPKVNSNNNMGSSSTGVSNISISNSVPNQLNQLQEKIQSQFLQNLNNFSLNSNSGALSPSSNQPTINTNNFLASQIYNSKGENSEDKETLNLAANNANQNPNLNFTSPKNSSQKISCLNFLFKKKVSSNGLRSFIGASGIPGTDPRKSPLKRASCITIKLGEVSNIKSPPPIEDEEEERIQYSSGDCFGEWAIIYNQPRSASAYVLEDADLFFLEKQAFIDHLAKFVVKSDVERKNFIKSRIPTFNAIQNFEIYYKRIVPLSVERNKTVYFEGTKGNFIYLVFHGEFVLEKDMVLHKNSEDKKYENRRGLLKLEKGSFAGLEILYEGECKYQYSLKSKAHDFNVLLRIDVESLDYNKEGIIDDLREIYYYQKKTLEDLLERHIDLKEKNTHRYVSKHELHSKSILNLLNYGNVKGNANPVQSLTERNHSHNKASASNRNSNSNILSKNQLINQFNTINSELTTGNDVKQGFNATFNIAGSSPFITSNNASLSRNTFKNNSNHIKAYNANTLTANSVFNKLNSGNIYNASNSHSNSPDRNSRISSMNNTGNFRGQFSENKKGGNRGKNSDNNIENNNENNIDNNNENNIENYKRDNRENNSDNYHGKKRREKRENNSENNKEDNRKNDTRINSVNYAGLTHEVNIGDNSRNKTYKNPVNSIDINSVNNKGRNIENNTANNHVVNPNSKYTLYIPNNTNSSKNTDNTLSLRQSHTPNPSINNKPAVHINYITAYSNYNSPKNKDKLKSRNISSFINEATLQNFNFSSTVVSIGNGVNIKSNMNVNTAGNFNFAGSNTNTKNSTATTTTPNSVFNTKLKIMNPFVKYFEKKTNEEGGEHTSANKTAALLNSIKKIKTHLANEDQTAPKKKSKNKKAYVPNKFITMCVKDWQDSKDSKDSKSVPKVHNKSRSSDFLFTTAKWSLPLVSLVKSTGKD